MSCKFLLLPWLRIMNKFETIVAQNEQICKEEAPPPHVEPLLMWKLHMWRHHYVEAPHMLSTMVAQNANLRNDGCAKCKFVQRRLHKMQICATILQIYSNLQGAEVVPPPKEVVPPPKEVVRPPKEMVPPPKEMVPPPKKVVYNQNKSCQFT